MFPMRARIRYNTNDPVMVEVEDVKIHTNMEDLLMQICSGIGEEMLGLMTGEDFGLGRMTLDGGKIAIRGYDRPLTLYFNCDTVEIAESLSAKINDYLQVPAEER
jgi:hypothetical protein